MITAELLGIEEDERRNILIWVCFTKDGVEIPFYRGANLLEYGGKKAWILYATWQNFLNKTQTQRLQWIKINVEHQIGNIIKGIVSLDSFVDEVKTQLIPFIGQTIQKDNVELSVDLDNDGVTDATLILKDDGTYSVI